MGKKTRETSLRKRKEHRNPKLPNLLKIPPKRGRREVGFSFSTLEEKDTVGMLNRIMDIHEAAHRNLFYVRQKNRKITL